MENCVVKKGSSGPYSITLLKDGEEIRIDDRVTVSSHSKSSATLRIASLRPEDVGNYTCTASNLYGSDSVTAALLVHEPPKVGEFSFPSKLAIGDEVIALCVVKKGSVGPYRITWRKDGAVLKPSERLSMSALFKSSAALSIASLRPEDVGNYTCTAANGVGSDSASAMLVVHEFSSSVFRQKLRSVTKSLWDAPSRKATSGPYRIAWMKDGKDIDSDGRLSVFGQSKTSAVLRITGVQPEDVGNYTCVAKNSFGTDSFTDQLVIHVPPKLQSTGFPSEISVGDDTAAMCLVTKGSSGPFDIAWHKDGEEVRSTDRIAVSVKASSAVLNIREVRVEDVGNYSCTATNRFGTDSLTLSLLVTDRYNSTACLLRGIAFPRRTCRKLTADTCSSIPVSSRTLPTPATPKVGELSFPSDVALGDEVIVTCVVKKGSAGPYRIAWDKDGREVIRDAGVAARVSVSTPSESSSTLRIGNLRAEDVGNYTCTASNRYGSDSVTAPLVVHGSSGPFKMAWHKDGNELRNTNRVSVISHVNSILLRVEGIQVNDIGNYTCSVANDFGTDVLTLPLLVTAPKVGKFVFPSDVALGDEIVESCVVKKGSVGPYRISLLKDGTQIEGSDRVSGIQCFQEQRDAANWQPQTGGRRELHVHCEQPIRQRQRHGNVSRQR
ncbi:hypothetical protein HPB49_017476 [Dermacentor silvarum]|uniref:Uncharacterized protein n=1 Tax=Dermacentor silvarum TaxID=543639 RepID=A0ACB8DQY5_DERSI|nr:hypothetical protein HPB49_017476 [Dermacentor silvarum]